MKLIIIPILLVSVLIISNCNTSYDDSQHRTGDKPTNFAECVKEGGIVMEIYPRQCRTKDGMTFESEEDRDRFEKLQYCEQEDIAAVYECDGYIKVVSSLLGGGSRYYMSDGTELVCPVVGSDSMSEECKQIIYDTKDCAELCNFKHEDLDKDSDTNAVGVATEYTMQMEQYTKEHGRHIRVIEVHQAKCPGCWTVDLEYLVDSEKGFQADKIKVSVQIKDYVAVDSTFAREGASILTPLECQSEGGTVRIATGTVNPCMPSEEEIGEVSEFISPHACCKSKNEDTGFCGSSTFGNCETSADCVPGGCSGQICMSKQDQPIDSTCEWKDCYDEKQFGLNCYCVESKCMWT